MTHRLMVVAIYTKYGCDNLNGSKFKKRTQMFDGQSYTHLVPMWYFFKWLFFTSITQT